MDREVLKKNAASIKKAVLKERDNIQSFLESLVNQNSFTFNKEGVGRVASILSGAMPAGFSHEEVDAGERFAVHHVFSRKGSGKKPVVLIGHMDTLWKPENPFKKMHEKGDKLIGPAVNDMKAGLAVIVWALRALDKCGLLGEIPVMVVFNSDEEVGSVDSKKIFSGLEDIAAGLVYEGGGEGGTVVTKRVGITDYALEIEVVAAHAGLYYGPKGSALLEMAHRLIWLESLNRGRNELSVNAGIAEGGLATNIVPGNAKCNFEIRFWDEKELERIERLIESGIKNPVVEGCKLKFLKGKHRPPLTRGQREKALFRLVAETASMLNLHVAEEYRNGGSDASWLSGIGVPSIDGLGPVGDLDRTEQEYILKETLFERIELTANLLLVPGLYSV